MASVDLGAVATEFLLLGIDPYPRKPGAVFDAPATGDPAGHPFAALAALKKDGTGKPRLDFCETARQNAQILATGVSPGRQAIVDLHPVASDHGIPGVTPPACRSIHASEGPHRS